MSFFIQGFLLTSSLIIAFGAQNIFILRQGLCKANVFWVAFIAFICDVVLMSLGVFGLGSILARSKTATLSISALGLLFLFIYGLQALIRFFRAKEQLAELEGRQESRSVGATVLATLAMSLLNPHIYIDTIIVVGGIASTLSVYQRGFFLGGSLLVSLLWFFGLAYGARLLLPIFKQSIAWRVLDLSIAIIMFWLALGLANYILTY